MYKKISVLAWFLFIGVFAMQAQVKQITSTEAEKLIADPNLVILDVRTAEEFKDGHVKGAINIDMKQPDGFNKIDALDQNASYVVYCRTNGRSTISTNHMAEKGFKNLYLISDGFEGWKKNELPVEK